MLQIIPKVSLLNAENEFKKIISDITLRGYLNKPPVSVTGGLKWDLDEGKIKPLSVSDITNLYCPTRRDVYMKHILRPKDSTNWGRITGHLVESCVCGFTDKHKNNGEIDKIRTYSALSNLSSCYMSDFKEKNRRKVSELAKYKTEPEEDENWLLCQLNYALRYEIIMSKARKKLSGNGSDSASIQYIEIKPNSKLLGISSPSTPDFIIPSFFAIGDIKTGLEFKYYFRLAAAGYALAYENQMGEGKNMNLGLIYYFPTRQRDISFAHLHIFVIDDTLRKEFLNRRDDALLIMRDAVNASSPKIPPRAKRGEFCIYCKYIKDCDELEKK